MGATEMVLLLLGSVFVLESLADVLNLGSLKGQVPEEFQGIFDPEKYRTALSYQTDLTRFDLLQRGLSFAGLAAFIWLGCFNQLDQVARGFHQGVIVTGLIFVGLLSSLRIVLHLPFSLVSTFVIEARYGFNQTTLGTFLGDLIKGTVLGSLIGGLVFSGLIYFFETAADWAWLYGWGALTVFQLLLGYLAPVIILPLFNRFEPLADGELKKAIEAYARTRKFRLSGIFTMDSSKRSSKSNAFFTGFGKLRKLVLFDTLIAKQSVEELVAVLAHEIGHFEKKHILHSMVLSIAVSGVMLFGFSLLLKNPELFSAFRMDEASIYAGLIVLGILSSPVMRILGICTSYLSRRNEFEADAFARETYGKPEVLIAALKKLSVDHLSHLTPHPLKVILEYSHPPVLQRIAALRKGEK
jgi:STE24 endopeptidase